MTEREPDVYDTNDRGMILEPSDAPDTVEVVRGPNIQPLPTRGPLDDRIEIAVLLKVGDNITTDHIMPAGSKILPLRSNIPAISEYVFVRVDPTFPTRAKEAGRGVILAGSNYGQGSSREHAALAPMYLGVQAVIAKSFARIHRANLINFGILPLTFSDESDYERVSQGETLTLENLHRTLQSGDSTLNVRSSTGHTLRCRVELSGRQRDILLSGGLLNHMRERGNTNGSHPEEAAIDAALHLATSTAMVASNGQFRPGRPTQDKEKELTAKS